METAAVEAAAAAERHCAGRRARGKRHGHRTNEKLFPHENLLFEN
jgi:hypothetical protein